MKVELASALNRASHRYALPLGGADNALVGRPLTTSEAPAVRVSLSPEASGAGAAARANASELRALLGKLDFRHISPRQMGQLGSELFTRNEITDVEASAFIGIELAFATRRDPDEPLDVVALFEKLLSDELKYQAEVGTDNGVRFRQAGLEALRHVMSFVASDRLHIAPQAGEHSPAARDGRTAQLHQLVSKYDLRNITPREMAQLGGALFERGEISESAASSFIGVERNLVEGLDPDKPMDMEKHFQGMLDVAMEAETRERGYFDFAVKFRLEASRALHDVMTFVDSGRDQIASGR